MSISAFNKCICGTLVTIVFSLLPVSFRASAVSSCTVTAGLQLSLKHSLFVCQEAKGDDAAAKQDVKKATGLLVETTVLRDTGQHLSFHTRAFLIHSVIKYQSLQSENICVRDLAKFQGKYKVSTKYIIYYI